VARVPVIRLGDTLIATVQEELYDHDVLQLQEDLGRLLELGSARGVLIDLSTVATVDSFLARLISSISAMARLLGAETVVVGIQPAVAVTLVELGLALQGMPTALNAEKGMALLDRLLAGERQQGLGYGP
jgi:rsbT antagonist protein RsbS